MHKWATLNARKDCGIHLFRNRLIVRHNGPAARSSQSLVGRERHNIGNRHRARVYAACDETCEMRHIDHEIRANGVRDLSEFSKVYFVL